MTERGQLNNIGREDDAEMTFEDMGNKPHGYLEYRMKKKNMPIYFCLCRWVSTKRNGGFWHM